MHCYEGVDGGGALLVRHPGDAFGEAVFGVCAHGDAGDVAVVPEDFADVVLADVAGEVLDDDLVVVVSCGFCFCVVGD